jgi:hypothetical protein
MTDDRLTLLMREVRRALKMLLAAIERIFPETKQ